VTRPITVTVGLFDYLSQPLRASPVLPLRLVIENLIGSCGWQVAVTGASQSMWWLYCQAVFSGLANFIASGMITSRTRRAIGPAALWLLVRAASLMMRVTRSRRRLSYVAKAWL
jgi:hypothetical protein